MKSILLLAFLMILCSQKPVEPENREPRNGTFEAKSQSYYDSENYWGYVKIKIQEGKIVEVKFKIRDSTLHESFDAKYEAHFAGDELYIQQSRNDWKGVQHYPQELVTKQDIKDVDAVSGATWSYNFFKSCVEKALKDTVGN